MCDIFLFCEYCWVESTSENKALSLYWMNSQTYLYSQLLVRGDYLKILVITNNRKVTFFKQPPVLCGHLLMIIWPLIGGLGLGLWCLTPLSIICQLYRGCQFYCIEYTSPWMGLELARLVVISTDCISNCKSNYHTIT
jgi:hypothetical protein